MSNFVNKYLKRLEGSERMSYKELQKTIELFNLGVENLYLDREVINSF